jgi:hypothetical protein
MRYVVHGCKEIFDHSPPAVGPNQVLFSYVRRDDEAFPDETYPGYHPDFTALGICCNNPGCIGALQVEALDVMVHDA